MQGTAEVFNLYLKNEMFVCICGRCAGAGESAVDLSPFIFSLREKVFVYSITYTKYIYTYDIQIIFFFIFLFTD